MTLRAKSISFDSFAPIVRIGLGFSLGLVETQANFAEVPWALARSGSFRNPRLDQEHQQFEVFEQAMVDDCHMVTLVHLGSGEKTDEQGYSLSHYP